MKNSLNSTYKPAPTGLDQDKIQSVSTSTLEKHLMASLKASARRGITRDGFDPLASNIMLHELDTFLLRLKRIVDRGRRQTATALAVFNAARTALALDRTAFRLITQNNRKISLSPPQDPYLRRITNSSPRQNGLDERLGAAEDSTSSKAWVRHFNGMVHCRTWKGASTFHSRTVTHMDPSWRQQFVRFGIRISIDTEAVNSIRGTAFAES